MLNMLLAPAVLKTILSVIVAILILLATITIHEFGHYIVGKLLKFKIKEFAIGMGPAIYKKTKKDGEIFSIRIFPLGGFCAFEGEDEDEETVAKKNKKLAEKEDINAFSEYEENGVTADTTNENAEGENVAKDTTSTDKEPKKYELSKDAFNNKKPWQRILVLLAGATFNFIVGIIIVCISFTAYGHFGFMAYELKTPSTTQEEEMSLSQGDILMEVNGKFMYFTTDLAKALNGKKKGDLVTVTVQHKDGTREEITVCLRADVVIDNMADIYPALDALGMATVLHIQTEEESVLSGYPYVYRFKDNEDNTLCTRIYTLTDLYAGLSKLNAGESLQLIVPDGSDADDKNDIVTLTAPLTFDSVDKSSMDAVLGAFGIKNTQTLSYQVSSETVRLGFFEGIGRGFVYSFKTVGLTLQTFGQLLTGNLSLDVVSGPIGTITITTQYVSMGFKYILNIASLIGLSVAIFNLLPIPALDGARAVFVLIEWIRKKPINRNVEAVIHAVGLVALLIFAIAVDVIKLF